MKQQARHSQYRTFRRLAKSAGYGKVRQADFRSEATLDTDGAQEAAAGVAWTKEFFGDTSDLLSVRTKEPKVSADRPMGNEYLVCARAISVEAQLGLTTLTTTERQEVLEKLSKCVLQLKSGPDVVFEKRLGYLLAGSASLDAASDGANGAGASVSQVGRVHAMKEGDDLDDAFIIFPGASIAAIIHGDGAWTTTDDIILCLNLHGWIATKGSVESGSKVLGLMDLIDDGLEAGGLFAGALKAA